MAIPNYEIHGKFLEKKNSKGLPTMVGSEENLDF